MPYVSCHGPGRFCLRARNQAMGCKANPETRERLRAEAFLCGVPRDRGLGVYGYMDEDLARTLSELPSL